MQDDLQIMPNIIKSAVNAGKKYFYRALSDFLREWALDDLLEDELYLKN